MGGLTPYQLRFDPRAIRDGSRLTVGIRRRVLRRLEFLRAAPFRSHPGVLVKEVAEFRGVWRFHLAADVRVHYIVFGDMVWVVLIERSAGITGKTLEEVRRRV